MRKVLLLTTLVGLLPVGLFAQQGDNNQQKPLVFTHVTVIDATGAPAKTDMTVVVKGELIEALGKTGKLTVPRNAQVVDATGKFLIPGLWDMYNYPHSKKEYLALLIANGLTGTRVMWGNPLHYTWRKEILAGELIGPRMFIAGQPSAGNEEAGRQAVGEIKKDGADFVRVEVSIPRNAYFAIADEANKLGVPFAGLLPYGVSLAEASDAGQKSIGGNCTFVLMACSSEGEEELRRKGKKIIDTPMGELERVYARYKLIADINHNEKKAAELFARFVRNSTWVCPTLIYRYEKLFSKANESRLKYMPLTIRRRWKNDVRLTTATEEIRANHMKIFEKNLAIVGAMNDAGVGLLAGTGTYMPGLDLQDELLMLVKAGLSPMEALQTATYNAAKCLGLLDSMGTVERGKVADLVLLDADPLQDINNTRKIAAVVVGGKIFDKPAIQEMLARVETLEHLHQAAANGDIGRVELLLSEGADVNSKCTEDMTPLHYAARLGHKEISEVLLAHGADVNAKNSWGGFTPLHLAVRDGQKDMVEYLIANGANVKEKDNYNRTPLKFAQRGGHTEIVELLRKHGAKE